jgi:serine/threonine protein phosphatase 1
VKVMAVGDIHGSLAQLNCLLQQNELFADRSILFLGDYVDIGPCSKGVIERLIKLKQERADCVFLLGNHEYEMLRYYDSGDFLRYAKCGGMHTIKSYVGEVHGDVHQGFVASISQAHIGFLRGLSFYYETAFCLFSHSGCSPEHQLDRTLDMMVLHSHQDLFRNPTKLSKLVVCGHYFQRTHTPFVSNSVICLDTGCGILNGPLTACLLPERKMVRIAPDLSVTVTG